MEILAIVFLILIGVVVILTFTAFRSDSVSKLRRIMTDLGLQGSCEEGAQFYKWGWHQDQGNRISAERIVKSAFQKSGVWLAREDLVFFENQCKRFESKHEMNDVLIEEKIREIIKRSEQIRRWVSQEVLSSLQYVQTLTPLEARDILKENRIESDLDQANEKLIGLNLQRMLYRHGAKIISLNAPGLQVQVPGSDQVYQLEKMDSWRHLLRMFKEEILDLTVGHKLSIQPSIARTLRTSIETGLLRDMEIDIERHLAFLKRIHDQFHNKEIKVSWERAKTIDAILYKWKLDEGTHFNQDDQNRVRDILVRLDLAPRFREILFERFDENFSSLHKLIRLFPRNVIFYGGNPVTSSFATDQYSRHFLALLEAFAEPSGRDTNPPVIIWVNEEQVEKMRQGPKRGANAISLTQLITEQQRISRLEQGVSEEMTHNRGWIVNLSINDLTVEEYESLNKIPFKKYVRFHCEAGDDVDFLNNTYNAKKSRVQFFNLVIDSLVEMPSLTQRSSQNSSGDRERNKSSADIREPDFETFAD